MRISLNDIFCFLGRTISATFMFWCMKILLKRALQRRLKRFRVTASPYCLETIKPKIHEDIGTNLKDKSPMDRDLDIFII